MIVYVTSEDKRLTDIILIANNDIFSRPFEIERTYSRVRAHSKRKSLLRVLSRELKYIKVLQRVINQATMDAFHFETNK